MVQVPEAHYMKGISMSGWQSAPDEAAQWTQFMKDKKKFAAGLAGGCRHWDLYEKDLQEVVNLGGNAFRFTIEWSRLQPKGPGEWDKEAIQRYHDMLDCMQKNGIEPMATLHQFVHPAWFEHMGAFEKEENLHHFQTFCVEVFKMYGQRIKLWAILNEPTVLAFMGYIGGQWPPGKLARFRTAGRVMGNLLRAHCRVYRALKALPGGSQAMIGFANHHMVFIPANNTPYTRWISKWMTIWIGTYSVLNFFRTGVFEWNHPFSGERPLVEYVDEGIKRGERLVDWWGINYYSRPAVHWNFMIGPGLPHEPVSDERFRLSPQGMYDSIVDGSKLGVPMYITEHGIADEKDTHRAWYIKATHAMILKAIADGYDVRGSYWWTLKDNCEWATGYTIKFGLYEWLPEYAKMYKEHGNRPPEGLKLREGAKAIQEVYRAWPNAMPELHAYARKLTAGLLFPQEGGYSTTERYGKEAVGKHYTMPAVHGADLAYQSLEATYCLTAASGTPPCAPGGGTTGRKWFGWFQVTQGPPSHKMVPQAQAQAQVQQVQQEAAQGHDAEAAAGQAAAAS